MRRVICCISVLVLGSSLIGCGQSGALQLPSDPNYDKRAKYLLYPNVESGQKTERVQTTEPADQQATTESKTSTP
ncbi:LPS translocon maturation chaperone LptM [Acinetobacter sp. NigerLNRRAM0016]